MEVTIGNLNRISAKIKSDIADLNILCENIEGEEVIIPKSASHPINKFIGRRAVLYNVCFDSLDGCIHAVPEVLYLDGSGRKTSYPETRCYVHITEDWFKS